MSTVYITSDWHLGHKNAYKFSGDFSSREEREGTILENYCQTVTKRDHVWFLGDIVFTPESLREFRLLQGTKHLVLGNHDTDKFSRRTDIADLCLVFDTIHGLNSYKDAWLSHAPIHPDELRGRYNIHGHVHSHSLPDTRYFNACLENTEFKPIKYQDVLAELRARASTT